MSRLKVSVDHGAIERNVSRLVAMAPTAAVMAVVKADAYGHGLVGAAAAARAGGATWLGVAQPDEALALRAAGDTGRLLCWLYSPELPARGLIRAGVDLSVSSLEVLDTIVAAARMSGERARLHVAIDTGLSREGVRPEGLPALLDAALAADDAVEIVGAWSHFAWADRPGDPTIDRQADIFRAALAVIEERGIALEVRHLANSAATLTRPDLHFDLVRPGIAVYGLPPVPSPPGDDWGLEPAMRVTASLALVKDVPAGEGVSYGHEYTTPRDTRLGLVTAGYADGIFRSAGAGRGPVAIGGRELRIVGRVCMDQVVLDLGPEATERAGDEVVLIGADGPSARAWAAAAGTIDYEIVCRFGGLKEKHPA
ncbi:alanine racemase [Demequina mangrovi]|uniref:Alanine racemase n=1 Tax=Demequina mangrovi TaxID=1043493 RepID=A0A1H6WIC1_9MICO|nr:alanine racemase [Demequina mangrovi]SEJ16789.1 alanine racemase [Demequina mangrovi]